MYERGVAHSGPAFTNKAALPNQAVCKCRAGPAELKRERNKL